MSAPGYTAHARVSYDYNAAHRGCNFILRLLTALAAGTTIVTMLNSDETVNLPFGLGAMKVRFEDFRAFQWFFLASCIVCGYAVLNTFVVFLTSVIGICTPGGAPLSSPPITWSAWVTFFFDFLLAMGHMSAFSSAMTIAWIAKKGQVNAGWIANCDLVGGFCNKMEVALIASGCGVVFLVLSTFLAARVIHMLHRTTEIVPFTVSINPLSNNLENF